MTLIDRNDDDNDDKYFSVGRKIWPLNADSYKSEAAGVDWARLKDTKENYI